MAKRIRLGDMLVKARLVTEEQLKQALEGQKETGRRLGEEMVARGFLSELQVTQVLSNQLSVPWVDLRHVEFSRELLGLVPSELAHESCVIPIYVRRLRGGDALFVAMDDPTNESTLAELAEVAGLSVKAMVAPPTDIRDAIGVYYFGKSPSAAMSLPPEAAEGEPTEDEPPESGLPDRDSSADSEPARRSIGPKLVTLTLLDGTTIRLPQKKRKGDEGQDQALTATDFVHALLAKAEGADVSNVLPDDGWETLVATLLSLMLKKGLIADWEFVDEVSRQRAKRKK
jgi:type IV pilus assembly protein PilB